MDNKKHRLAALDKEGFVRAIVETAKGSRYKYKYDPDTSMFECYIPLKSGLSFPFDFGFVPSTKAADGDPLDIIVLADEPTFTGCLVKVRLIGVLEVEQKKDGKTIRNDRLIGVHKHSLDYARCTSWKDLPTGFRQEIEMFFQFYGESRGKIFQLIGWRSSKIADQLLNKSLLKR